MHVLNWLNERGCILRGAFQPIEGMHFYLSRFHSRYRSRCRGLCDRAFTLFCMVLGSHYIHVLSGVNVEKTQAHYMGIRTRNACILEQMSKTSVPNLTNKPNSVN